MTKGPLLLFISASLWLSWLCEWVLTPLPCSCFVTICIFYLISCTLLWTRFLSPESEQSLSCVFSDNACSCVTSPECDTWQSATRVMNQGRHVTQWGKTTSWTLWSNKLNYLRWIRLHIEFWSVMWVFIETLQVALLVPQPGSSCPSCLEFDKLKLYRWQHGAKELSWQIWDRDLASPPSDVSLEWPDLFPPHAHATLTKITAVSSFCAPVSSQWLQFSFDSAPGPRSRYGLPLCQIGASWDLNKTGQCPVTRLMSLPDTSDNAKQCSGIK